MVNILILIHVVVFKSWMKDKAVKFPTPVYWNIAIFTPRICTSPLSRGGVFNHLLVPKDKAIAKRTHDQLMIMAKAYIQIFATGWGSGRSIKLPIGSSSDLSMLSMIKISTCTGISKNLACTYVPIYIYIYTASYICDTGYIILTPCLWNMSTKQKGYTGGIVHQRIRSEWKK